MVMLEEFPSRPLGPCHATFNTTSLLPAAGRLTVQNNVTMLLVWNWLLSTDTSTPGGRTAKNYNK